MTDWIDDLANKAKELYSAQREEDERFNREQKLLEQFSKEYWRKLQAQLKEAAEEFNERFGSEVVKVASAGQDKIEVSSAITRKIQRSAQIALRPEIQGFIWTDHVNQKSHEFRFRLDVDRSGPLVVAALRGGTDIYIRRTE